MLTPYILPIIPKHFYYVEPFFGGGAVFWAKNASQIETINDKNACLIIFYEQIKNNFDELNQLVQATLYSEDLHKKAKNIYENNNDFSLVEIAWSVFFLAISSMNSSLGDSFRIGKTLSHSMPRDLGNKKKNFVQGLASRLEHTTILNRDALKVISQLDSSKTFFYIDPPYIDCNQGHYFGYTKEEYIELLDILVNIDGKFMLSSFPNEVLAQYIEENKWIKKEIVKVKPSSSHLDKLDNKIEVLAMNYNPHIGELF